MAGSTEEVILRIRADVNQALAELRKVQDGLGKTERSTSSFAKTVDNLRNVAGFYALYQGYQQVIKAASDLEEQSNKFKVVFAGSMGIAKKGVDELTESYAMSERMAMEYTSTIGNMLSGMGLASDKAAEMSVNLTKLAADYASFNNVSLDEALTAFRAGLAGEMEPMRRFGKDLSEMALKQEALRMGILKTNGPLDQQTKALATYNILMNKSTNEMGDMIRTSDSWANTQKKLNARFEDFKAMIGGVILTDLQRVAVAIGNLSSKENMSGLQGILKWAWEFTKIITGSKLIGSIYEIGSAFKGMLDEVKAKNTGEFDKWKTGASFLQQGMSTGIKQGTDEQNKAGGGSSPGGIPKTVDYAKQQEEYLTYIEQFNMLAYSKEQERYAEMLKYAEDHGLSIEQINEQHQANMEMIETEGMAKRAQVAFNYASQVISIAQNTAQSLASIQQMQNQQEQQRLTNKYNVWRAIANKFIKDEEQREKALENIDLMYEYFKKQLARREFERNKAYQIANVWINAASGIVAGWSAAMQPQSNGGVWYLGIALAAVSTALMLAMAGAQTGLIAAQQPPALAEGGLIQGTMGGTHILAGERGMSEAIIPLENPEAQSKLGGLGTTYNIYFDGAILANENLPEDFIRAIDRGMYRLNQRKDSVFAEAMK